MSYDSFFCCQGTGRVKFRGRAYACPFCSAGREAAIDSNGVRMGPGEAGPISGTATSAKYTDARLMAKIEEARASGETDYSLARQLGINSAHLYHARHNEPGPTLREAAIAAGWFREPGGRTRAAFDAAPEIQALINERAEALGISRSAYLQRLVLADAIRARISPLKIRAEDRERILK